MRRGRETAFGKAAAVFAAVAFDRVLKNAGRGCPTYRHPFEIHSSSGRSDAPGRCRFGSEKARLPASATPRAEFPGKKIYLRFQVFKRIIGSNEVFPARKLFPSGYTGRAVGFI